MLSLLVAGCGKTEQAGSGNSMATTSSAETIDTRIGKLSFTHDFNNGYPTDETQQKLFDEMDFQRATQAYIWAIPIVGFAQWEYANTHDLGAKNGQIVYAKGYDALREGLTANTTTPYSFSWTDLTKEPWIVEIPKGTIRGAAHNIWQIGLSPMTKAGNYLFVGPENKVPAGAKKAGYTVVKSNSNNVMQVLRLMSEDPKEQLEILKQIKIYPYSERNNPKPRGYITPNGRRYRMWQPRGMAYWRLLSEIINREPVQERDRFFMAMLKPLGIEKGKPFKPNARQTKILEQAVLVGEAMAKANDFFNPRLEDSIYVKGSQWEYATTGVPNQRRKYYEDLDGRAAWLYEALTNNMAMHGQKTGKGQIYLASYKDADGDWLDGEQNYVLHIPANVPAKVFWAFNVYDVSSRTPILNDTRLAGRSSRMDLLVNADGSVDIYTGPDKPAGDKAKNWIQTVPGKAWFPYFRLYSPKQAFLDKSWILPDIEKIK
jgi:hypothetical protein